MASTALESTHSNTEEPSMETSSFQTDQLEVTSANASSDAQMTPKRCQSKERPWGVVRKKWSALKKRRKSLAFGRKENETNGSMKPLTLENRQLKLQTLASIKVTNAGISFGENHIIIEGGLIAIKAVVWKSKEPCDVKQYAQILKTSPVFRWFFFTAV